MTNRINYPTHLFVSFYVPYYSKILCMNTTERKYQIIKQLLQVEEESVLFKIEKVLKEENSIHPVLLHLLEASNLEAEKNKGKSHSDVMSKLKQKYF
jgi:hypothetical protein